MISISVHIRINTNAIISLYFDLIETFPFNNNMRIKTKFLLKQQKFRRYTKGRLFFLQQVLLHNWLNARVRLSCRGGYTKEKCGAVFDPVLVCLLDIKYTHFYYMPK